MVVGLWSVGHSLGWASVVIAEYAAPFIDCLVVVFGIKGRVNATVIALYLEAGVSVS